jgi:hypothetical protein
LESAPQGCPVYCIPAAKIGEIAQKEQGVKIRSEQRLKDVPMFARDEIARILEKA